MYLVIVAVVLMAGIYTSWFIHGKRFLPLGVLIVGIVVYMMMRNGIIGPMGITILAVLSIVIWGGNMITEKLK